MSRHNGGGGSKSDSEGYELKLFRKTIGQTALAADKNILSVKINGVDEACAVARAAPDGDCAFTSIRLSLQLQGHRELSEKFTRDNYIRIITEQSKKTDLDPAEREKINAIFRIDKAQNSADWSQKLGRRWLEQVDFEFLSQHFNLEFQIYCELDGKFEPEPSYEKIWTGGPENQAHAISVALAHVSTQLKDSPDASLNHFDALILKPTPEQTREIEAINSSNMPVKKRDNLSARSAEANTLSDSDSLLLADLFNVSAKEADAVRGKRVVLMVGETGVGKTTTLYRLVAPERVTVTFNEEYGEDVVNVSQDSSIGEVGGGEDSVTWCPKVVTGEGFTFCDLPGFGDTRELSDLVKKLCSLIALPLVFDRCESVGAILFFVNYRGIDNRKYLRSLAATLNSFFSIKEKKGANLDSFLFVFTHVPKRLSSKNIVAQLESKITGSKIKNDKGLERSIEECRGKIIQLVSKNYPDYPMERLDAVIASAMHQEEQENIAAEMDDLLKDEFGHENYEPGLKSLFLYIRECSTAIVVLTLLAYRPEGLFLIDGTSPDDRERLLQTLGELNAAEKIIPKELFNFQMGRYKELQILRPLIEGNIKKYDELNHSVGSLLQSLVSLREYKKQRVSLFDFQTSSLSQLRLSGVSDETLAQVVAAIKKTHEFLFANTDQSNEARKSQLEKDRQELDELDTAELVDYQPDSLKPVGFENNKQHLPPFIALMGSVMALPLPVGLAAGLLSLIPLGVKAAIMGHDLKKGKEAAVEKGLEDLIKSLYSIAKPLVFYLGSATAVLRKTHRFRYQGSTPISDYVLTPGRYKAGYDPNQPSEAAGLDMMCDIMIRAFSKHYGFGFKQVKVSEYVLDATCVRHGIAANKKDEKLEASITLKVQKRLLPENEKRIGELNHRLLNLSHLDRWLSSDVALYRSTYETSEHLLDKKERIKWRDSISHFLKELLRLHSSFAADMDQIHFGILSAIRGVISDYRKNKPVFDMIQALGSLIGLEKTYSDTLRDMSTNHIISQTNSVLNRKNETVWARKAAENRWLQPPYKIPEKRNKLGGVNIKAVIDLEDKPGSPWLAKIGIGVHSNPASSVAADRVSPESRPRADVALTAVCEHAAAYLYQCLNDSGATYRVAKFRLAELPIINVQTRHHGLTTHLKEMINDGRSVPIERAVYLLSKMVPGYRDLCELDRCVVVVDGSREIVSFEQCLKNQLLPDEVEVIDKKGETRSVPLYGLIELLAASRLLADTDVLGGRASNAGYCYEKGSDGEITGVRVIKVDPGESFSFDSPFNQFFKREQEKKSEQDLRFIQYANQQPSLPWSSLTQTQQQRFEQALKNGLVILKKMISENDATQKISLQGVTDNELYRTTSAGKTISSIEPVFKRFPAYLERLEQIYLPAADLSQASGKQVEAPSKLDSVLSHLSSREKTGGGGCKEDSVPVALKK